MIINTLWGKEEILETKVCVVCKIEKLYSDFPTKPDRADKMHINCKACEAKRLKNAARMKLAAPPKPDTCECCGIVPTHWVADHDHKTNKFRGWICKSCNNALGLLGDNISGVFKAVRYLSRCTN